MWYICLLLEIVHMSEKVQSMRGGVEKVSADKENTQINLLIKMLFKEHHLPLMFLWFSVKISLPFFGPHCIQI